MMASQGFYDITLGNVLTYVLTLITVWIAYTKLKEDQAEHARLLKNEQDAHAQEVQKERETAIAEQAKMHQENRSNFERLINFHEDQLKVNRMRDEQVAALRESAASLVEIQKGIERRLQMLEDTQERRGRPRG